MNAGLSGAANRLYAGRLDLPVPLPQTMSEATVKALRGRKVFQVECYSYNDSHDHFDKS